MKKGEKSWVLPWLLPAEMAHMVVRARNGPCGGNERKTTMAKRKQIEAERITRQLKQTAAERYADLRRDIAILMDCIEMELDAHAERAAEKPTDWGFVGDMARIREAMSDILRTLLIGRHGWSETEATRVIEDHLDAMREDANR